MQLADFTLTGTALGNRRAVELLLTLQFSVMVQAPFLQRSVFQRQLNGTTGFIRVTTIDKTTLLR